MSIVLKPLLLSAALTLLVAGCGKKHEAVPAKAAAAPAAPVLEGEVSIIARAGDIERGESDRSVDWVSGFEKETGCRVNVRMVDTSDEMAALVNQGGSDLVIASGDTSLRLIAGGKVQPIDITRIKSWSGVDPRLQNAAWHTVDGKHYGVPWQWGPNVLMYNTKTFKTAPIDWSVVFEEQKLPDGKSNAGRVQAFAEPIYIADAAVYLMGKKPELGITDPYELNEAQYAAALTVLRAQKALVHQYWQDAGKQISDFKSEGVVASGSRLYQVNALQAEKPAQPIASTVPAEGATGWADTTMLHAQARHPNCAYAWMEWSLHPKVQGDAAERLGSVPAVPAACGNNALLGVDGCKTHGSDDFDRIHFWRTPQAKCGTGDCVPYSRWTQDYTTIMGN